jgi:hypothetical protein
MDQATHIVRIPYKAIPYQERVVQLRAGAHCTVDEMQWAVYDGVVNQDRPHGKLLACSNIGADQAWMYAYAELTT